MQSHRNSGCGGNTNNNRSARNPDCIGHCNELSGRDRISIGFKKFGEGTKYVVEGVKDVIIDNIIIKKEDKNGNHSKYKK